MSYSRTKLLLDLSLIFDSIIFLVKECKTFKLLADLRPLKKEKKTKVVTIKNKREEEAFSTCWHETKQP